MPPITTISISNNLKIHTNPKCLKSHTLAKDVFKFRKSRWNVTLRWKGAIWFDSTDERKRDALAEKEVYLGRCLWQADFNGKDRRDCTCRSWGPENAIEERVKVQSERNGCACNFTIVNCTSRMITPWWDHVTRPLMFLVKTSTWRCFAVAKGFDLFIAYDVRDSESAQKMKEVFCILYNHVFCLHGYWWQKLVVMLSQFRRNIRK